MRPSEQQPREIGWRRRFLGCFHPIQDRSLDHGEIKSPQFRLCDSDHNPIRLIECGPEASVALARYDRVHSLFFPLSLRCPQTTLLSEVSRCVRQECLVMVHPGYCEYSIIELPFPIVPP